MLHIFSVDTIHSRKREIKILQMFHLKEWYFISNSMVVPQFSKHKLSKMHFLSPRWLVPASGINETALKIWGILQKFWVNFLEIVTIFKHHFTLELLWIISKFVSVLQIVEMYLSKLCILLWKFEIELIQSCNSKSNFKDYEIRGRLSLLVNKDWVSQLTLSFLSPGVLLGMLRNRYIRSGD